jgi:hypothetical protein
LAAINLTEGTDALAVVVSEETGTISMVSGGKLIRHLDEGELARLLFELYRAPATPAERWLGALGRAGDTAPDDPAATRPAAAADQALAVPGSKS